MNLFPDHPRLETERFVLRAPRSDEIDFLFSLGLSFWEGKPAETLEIARESIRKTAKEYAAGRCYHWIAETKAGGEVVGSVGFYRGFEENRGEVGYVMNAAYRGRAIMTELLARALDFGFHDKKLDRIVAVTRPENLPSVALLTRAGFTFESNRDDGYAVYGRRP